MGEWSFLAALLEKVQTHSTVVGKVWLTVLFVFRLLILMAGIDKVWGDEQSRMECNSRSPGCKLACYDHMFPISHMRFWVMQIIFVSTPTLLYLGHVIHVVNKENKLRQKLLKNDGRRGLMKLPKYTDDKGKIINLQGSLLVSYMASILFRIVFEVAFIVGQYFLFGFTLPVKIQCEVLPCKGLGQECFISRPTEKTIFIIFMLVMACVSLLLNVLEMLHLLSSSIKRRKSGSTPPELNMHALGGESEKKAFC